MKQGDFTALAKDYVNRTGYSLTVLRHLAAYQGGWRSGFAVADVGAGTGKLTGNLWQVGLAGFAVEPNDAMRAEGMRLVGDCGFDWRAGSGEVTGLPDSSVDWVLMASSFHWTRQQDALREFQRILRPGGCFTALWNPRDLVSSEIHQRIEQRIGEIVPGLNRVSSGSSKYTQGIESTLVSGGLFDDLIFMEAPHSENMTRERYLGAWRSVNDIQAQAGPERFAQILQMIETELDASNLVVVPYKTRAWTVRSTKR